MEKNRFRHCGLANWLRVLAGLSGPSWSSANRCLMARQRQSTSNRSQHLTNSRLGVCECSNKNKLEWAKQKEIQVYFHQFVRSSELFECPERESSSSVRAACLVAWHLH